MMIGHFYGHVILTMWKLSKKTSFLILKERTRGGKTILALLALLYWFLWCFDIEVLYVKFIYQAAIV